MKFKNPVTQTERQNQIQRWLQDRLGERPGLVELAGDASFRRYYRVKASRQSFVLMDAQLDDENVKQFVFVTKLLQRSGLRVPTIEHADLQNDLLLLEDLGDRLLLNCLNKGNVKGFYFQAVKDLLLIQHANTDGLSLYSEAKLRKEMEIFKDWLCGQYLGYRFSQAEENTFESAKQFLVHHALDQPQVFVHGDYHSRNILVVADGLAHIDYQDAVLGPLSYDLVSLLRDCYIEWPNGDVEVWIEYYLSLSADVVYSSGFTMKQFKRWFDLMGLQRHLKASGIFCRLLKRDGKIGYLNDVQRIFGYTLNCCDQYPELREFRKLLKRLYDLFVMVSVPR